MKTFLVFALMVAVLLLGATAASARWVPGLVHIHQDSKVFEDDGSRTQDGIVDKAIQQHLKFVITTPHYHPGNNRTAPSQSDKIILIDGAEIETIWGGDMRSHLLVIGDFYGDPIIDQLEGENNTQQQLINRVNEPRLISVAAHPTLIKIVNLELWKGQSGNFCFDMGNIRNLCGVEWFNSGKDGYEGTRRISLLLSQLQNIFFTAGCDSHIPADPNDGIRWSRITWVWVEGELTKEKIMDAFRQGRTFASQYGAYIKNINHLPGFDYKEVDRPRFALTLGFGQKTTSGKTVRLYRGQNKICEINLPKGKSEYYYHFEDKVSPGRYSYIIEVENCLVMSPIKLIVKPQLKPQPKPKPPTLIPTPPSVNNPNLYRDPVDEQIKNTLREKWLHPTPGQQLFYTQKDADCLKNFFVDRRVMQMMVKLANNGHSIAVRINDGYDTPNPAVSRETYYASNQIPNVSSHWSAQAFDIFYADGVEMAWQISPDPVKRQKAQAKIRELLQKMFQYGRQDNNLLPTQIMIYNQNDVNYFSAQLNQFYGPPAQRYNSGMWASVRMWDRIHVGY